jgi:hypothetical protein
MQPRLRWHPRGLPGLQVAPRSLGGCRSSPRSIDGCSRSRAPWPRSPGSCFGGSGSLMARSNQLQQEITRLVRPLVPTLLALPGCGPLSAAKLLGRWRARRAWVPGGVCPLERHCADPGVVGQRSSTSVEPRRQPPGERRFASHRAHAVAWGGPWASLGAPPLGQRRHQDGGLAAASSSALSTRSSAACGPTRRSPRPPQQARRRSPLDIRASLIIQTIRWDRSRSDGIDKAPNLSRADPAGAELLDDAQQATDLAVGGSNPSRRASKAQVKRPACLLCVSQDGTRLASRPIRQRCRSEPPTGRPLTCP